MELMHELRERDELDEKEYIPAEFGVIDKNIKNERVLYRFQYDLINNKLNIVGRLLITLSTIPILGWFFDVLILMYAVYVRDLKLAVFTIIGALTVIGRNFAKNLYLFDESQKIKKALTDPGFARIQQTKSNLKDKISVTTPEIINGEYYLVNEEGSVFSPIISGQREVGKLSNDRSRIKFHNSQPPPVKYDEYRDLKISESQNRKRFISDINDIMINNNINPVKMENIEDNTNNSDKMDPENKKDAV